MLADAVAIIGTMDLVFGCVPLSLLGYLWIGSDTSFCFFVHPGRSIGRYGYGYMVCRRSSRVLFINTYIHSFPFNLAVLSYVDRVLV